RLLETTRQYAREKLTAAGEEETWCVRHRDYFLALAEEAHEKRFISEGPALMKTLEREHDNCRAALDLCEARSDAEAHLRLAGALNQFWALRGHFREGRTRLAVALSRPDAQVSSPRARALNGAANLARIQSDNDAARLMYERSAEIWRALGQKRHLSMVLTNLGILEQQQGRYDLSQALYDESLMLIREQDDPAGLSLLLNNSGWLAYVQGDPTRARALLEESLVLSRAIGNQIILELAGGNLADIAMKQSDYATARVRFREVFALQAASRNEHSLIKTLEIVGELAACLQQPGRGVRLFAAAAALSERRGTPVYPDDRAEYDRRKQLLRIALDEEAFSREWEAGFALTTEEALALAQEIL
ncbi:MAG TPA: tetratricopeptide repeat protein, partial [Ktedonobacterales bacterium]|nr:tetratricopeptide repeat protein [Ktedonobacterales bacterium]